MMYFYFLVNKCIDKKYKEKLLTVVHKSNIMCIFALVKKRIINLKNNKI